MRKAQITKPIARRRSWYNEGTANKTRIQQNAKKRNNATQTYKWIQIHDCHNVTPKTQFLPKHNRSEKSHRCCIALVEFLKHRRQYIAWAKKWTNALNMTTQPNTKYTYQQSLSILRTITNRQTPMRTIRSKKFTNPAEHELKNATQCAIYFSHIHTYIYTNMSVHVYKYVYICIYINIYILRPKSGFLNKK